MKIQMKIFAITIALIMVTGVATIIVSQSITEDMLKDGVYLHLESTAQSRADHVETVLNEYKELTGMMAVGNAFRGVVDGSKDYVWRMEQVNLRIQNTIGAHNEISRIRVLDTNGTVIASSLTDVGLDRSTSDIFLKGKTGVYVGDIHTSRLTGNTIISTSAPILVNGEFSGVIVLNFDVEKELFGITTERTGLGETGEIYLVNGGGYMITPSRFVGDVVLEMEASEISHTKDDYSDTAVMTVNYQGTRVLQVHKHIDEVGWVLVAEIGEEEALAPVARLTRTSMILVAILLIAGVVVSMMLTGQITKPLLDLSMGVEDVKGGNLDHRVGTNVEDEIGDLSRSFDEMTDEIRRSRVEMEEYNISLESQVEERTKKLVESEEYLKELVDKLRISQESLSAPVVAVWDGILALPLIGMIDEHRIATIMQTLLTDITQTQSDVVILDVTGVHEIDTYVTGQLIKIVRAARLLGATCIITGVRPESAHTLVDLGMDTSELVTRRTLQEGLRYALKITGGG
ncbi:MAG: cache domain-containing protein [Euryarchaeota archaeon]|nr:cache domain-containing protein [Euryarchaeota archaeon]